MRMKTHPQYFISKPRRSTKTGMTIGIDLGDIWSHYCTLNEDGEVVDRGRFRTNPSGVDKRFRDIEPARVAMEAGTHSIWVSAQIRELGHEVIVANVRELRAISHSDRKSDNSRRPPGTTPAPMQSSSPSPAAPPMRRPTVTTPVSKPRSTAPAAAVDKAPPGSSHPGRRIRPTTTHATCPTSPSSPATGSSTAITSS